MFQRCAAAAQWLATAAQRLATAAQRLATAAQRLTTAAQRLATAAQWLATAGQRSATAGQRSATAAQRLATAAQWSATAAQWLATAAQRLTTAAQWLTIAAQWLATADHACSRPERWRPRRLARLRPRCRTAKPSDPADNPTLVQASHSAARTPALHCASGVGNVRYQMPRKSPASITSAAPPNRLQTASGLPLPTTRLQSRFCKLNPEIPRHLHDASALPALEEFPSAFILRIA